MLKFLSLLLVAFSLTGAEISPDHLALGAPGGADKVLAREGFALGYVNRHRQPAWVIYHLSSEKVLSRAVGPSVLFRADPAIPGGSAAPADYRRSGYDRGHLAAVADMAWSTQAMADSFLMSNISPQKPAFNRGIWARLEAQIRVFAFAERDIYVVTGPVLPTEPTISIGPKRVTVPTCYYKVVYDLTPPRKMIAFLLPNEGNTRPLQDFTVTVDVVEVVTGLDFFPLLPRLEQQRLESTISVDAWNWRVRK